MRRGWRTRSTSARSEAVAEGWLYDGESAVRREVTVEAEGRSALLVRLPGGEALSVPKDKLTFVESRRDCDIYGRSDVAGFRRR
jgi:hypothetical protein